MNIYDLFELRTKVKEFIQAALGLSFSVLLVSVLITGLALIGGDPKSESKPEKQAAITKKKEVKPSPKVTDKVSSKKYVKPKPSVKPAAAKVVPLQRVQSAVVYTGNCEQYRYLISKYSWNVAVAMAICAAESGGNPRAANWGDNHMSWAGCMGSFGLFQINCSNGQLYDPAANVAKAFAMYQVSYWNPWTTWTSGKYLNYLK